MLVKIEAEVKFKNKVPFQIEKTKKQAEQIKKNWEKFIVGKTNFFNGEIYTVTNISNINKNYTLEIAKANFADLVYAKQTKELTINSLFSSVLLKTKDNYYVLVRDRNNRINLPGGMANKKDFIDNNYDPTICLIREVEEEIGINLNDKDIVLNYYPAYLKLPLETTETMYPTGVVYIANLALTKEDLEKHFKRKKDNLDHEIIELIFATKENYKNYDEKDDSRTYITEVIKFETKNNKY